MIYPVRETLEKNIVRFWYKDPKSEELLLIGRAMLDSFLTFEEYQGLKKTGQLKMQLNLLFNPENQRYYLPETVTPF